MFLECASHARSWATPGCYDIINVCFYDNSFKQAKIDSDFGAGVLIWCPSEPVQKPSKTVHISSPLAAIVQEFVERQEVVVGEPLGENVK